MKRTTCSKISGAWFLEPTLHGTPGRLFMDIFRTVDVADVAGTKFLATEVSLAVTAEGSVRGLHYGREKIVTCTNGAVLDVIIDLRRGSPTFGQVESVHLDDQNRWVAYIPRGLAHGYCALTPNATLVYLFSEAYDPTAEHEIHPLDPALNIRWPTDDPGLSARDATAQTLAEAIERGQLPVWTGHAA